MPHTCMAYKEDVSGSAKCLLQIHNSFLSIEPEAGTSETNTSGTLVNRLSMEVTTSWQERALVLHIIVLWTTTLLYFQLHAS